MALRPVLQRKLGESSPDLLDEGFEFRFVTFQDVKASLVRIFGTPARAIIYDAGIDPGRRSYDRMANEAESGEEVLKLLVRRKAGQNWGKISVEHVDWKTNSGRISVDGCFEARGRMATQLSTEPSCDFFRGYLAGFFSELFDGDLRVVEEKCMTMGDVRCVFSFRSSP